MIRVKLSEDELRRLRVFRTDAWLLQNKVAKSLNIKVNTFANYESGVVAIPLEFLEKLAGLYSKEEIKKFGVKVEGKDFVKKQVNEYKESKYSKKETPNFSDEEERKRVHGILNSSEVYDFSKMCKPFRTVQSDELNFYVPEKWKR